MQRGGSADRAAINPPEEEKDYPEPSRFCPLPAQALFGRHGSNFEIGNFKIVSENPDARPVCWLGNVDGAEFLRFRPPLNRRAAAFLLKDTRHFRVGESSPVSDTTHFEALP